MKNKKSRSINVRLVCIPSRSQIPFNNSEFRSLEALALKRRTRTRTLLSETNRAYRFDFHLLSRPRSTVTTRLISISICPCATPNARRARPYKITAAYTACVTTPRVTNIAAVGARKHVTRVKKNNEKKKKR